MTPADGPTWDEIYAGGGQLNRYPYDVVVSFVFRNAPDRPRTDVQILEVGCGAGNNLWFAAREGFRVAGIDASQTAVEHARRRFADEGLVGDLRVGSFTELPFEDRTFDLVIDRGALTCVPRDAAVASIAEIARVLQLGGRFLFTPFSERHSSRTSGRDLGDGYVDAITGGPLVDVGPIRFYSRSDIDDLFDDGWRILSVDHVEATSETSADVHAEWRVVAERT